MAKKNRKPKDTTFRRLRDEEWDDDDACPGIVTDEHGVKRAVRPGEVERVITGDELAAEFARNASLLAEFHPDTDEPLETGRKALGPANNAGLVASETGVGAPTTPANNAGSEDPTAPEATTKSKSAHSSKSRSSSTTGRPEDSRKKKDKAPATAKHPAKPKRSAVSPGADLTDAELASLRQQYTYEQAKLWRDVPTDARTDAAFRQEPAHFWDNWRDLNKKKEGTTMKAFTDPWKNHKLGSLLWARYRNFRTFAASREKDDRRGVNQPAKLTTAAVQQQVIGSSSETVITVSSDAQVSISETISSTTIEQPRAEPSADATTAHPAADSSSATETVFTDAMDGTLPPDEEPLEELSANDADEVLEASSTGQGQLNSEEFVDAFIHR